MEQSRKLTDHKKLTVLNAVNEPLTMADLPPATEFGTRWTVARKFNAVQAYKVGKVGNTVIDEAFLRQHWNMSTDEMKLMTEDVAKRGIEGLSVRHLKAKIQARQEETERARSKNRKRAQLTPA